MGLYRALYRKWRPRRFADVVGQEGIVTALQNQVKTGHVGHAYLFTGTRGTGKTTCAKIFAKAVNCPTPLPNGDPCCECSICKGIEDSTILDVIEMDAASNNKVDDIRDLRDETIYTPSVCTKKVYIIDEVHMLSTSAFNALLKTMEEPPPHILFILATTEIHKVPATILSRCQRYDFRRINPEDIMGRIQYVAKEEGIDLSPAAASLIAQLADGALRDALSILDTCSGVSSTVDEAIVRKMAGVTDRAYLFELSSAVAQKDCSAVLEKVAELRREAVDMKRLCEELITHYRNLMLVKIPRGEQLLTGCSPEEIEKYQAGSNISQDDSIYAITVLGKAMEKMMKSSDSRIELELALISLCGVRTMPVTAEPTGLTFERKAAPVSSSWNPVVPAMPADAPVQQTSPQPSMPVQEPTAVKSSPAAAPALRTQKTNAVIQEPVLLKEWNAINSLLAERNKMLAAYLKGSRAFFDGRRVLIEGGSTFRDYIRSDKDVQKLIKDAIEEVMGQRFAIGPYTPPEEKAAEKSIADIETIAADLLARGAEVQIN